MNRRLPGVWLVATSVLITSRNDDPPAEEIYLPKTSEYIVLENLQRAFEMRDTDAYAPLLAADCKVYPDPVTSNQLGFEY